MTPAQIKLAWAALQDRNFLIAINKAGVVLASQLTTIEDEDERLDPENLYRRTARLFNREMESHLPRMKLSPAIEPHLSRPVAVGVGELAGD